MDEIVRRGRRRPRVARWTAKLAPGIELRWGLVSIPRDALGVRFFLPACDDGGLIPALRFGNRVGFAGGDLVAKWGEPCRTLRGTGYWRSKLLRGIEDPAQARRAAKREIARLRDALAARRAVTRSDGHETAFAVMATEEMRGALERPGGSGAPVPRVDAATLGPAPADNVDVVDMADALDWVGRWQRVALPTYPLDPRLDVSWRVVPAEQEMPDRGDGVQVLAEFRLPAMGGRGKRLPEYLLRAVREGRRAEFVGEILQRDWGVKRVDPDGQAFRCRACVVRRRTWRLAFHAARCRAIAEIAALSDGLKRGCGMAR